MADLTRDVPGDATPDDDGFRMTSAEWIHNICFWGTHLHEGVADGIPLWSILDCIQGSIDNARIWLAMEEA